MNWNKFFQCNVHVMSLCTNVCLSQFTRQKMSLLNRMLTVSLVTSIYGLYWDHQLPLLSSYIHYVGVFYGEVKCSTTLRSLYCKWAEVKTSQTEQRKMSSLWNCPKQEALWSSQRATQPSSVPEARCCASSSKLMQPTPHSCSSSLTKELVGPFLESRVCRFQV